MSTRSAAKAKKLADEQSASNPKNTSTSKKSSTPKSTSTAKKTSESKKTSGPKKSSTPKSTATSRKTSEPKKPSELKNTSTSNKPSTPKTLSEPKKTSEPEMTSESKSKETSTSQNQPKSKKSTENMKLAAPHHGPPAPPPCPGIEVTYTCGHTWNEHTNLREYSHEIGPQCAILNTRPNFACFVCGPVLSSSATEAEALDAKNLGEGFKYWVDNVFIGRDYSFERVTEMVSKVKDNIKIEEQKLSSDLAESKSKLSEAKKVAALQSQELKNLRKQIEVLQASKAGSTNAANAATGGGYTFTASSNADRGLDKIQVTASYEDCGHKSQIFCATRGSNYGKATEAVILKKRSCAKCTEVIIKSSESDKIRAVEKRLGAAFDKYFDDFGSEFTTNGDEEGSAKSQAIANKFFAGPVKKSVSQLKEKFKDLASYHYGVGVMDTVAEMEMAFRVRDEGGIIDKRNKLVENRAELERDLELIANVLQQKLVLNCGVGVEKLSKEKRHSGEDVEMSGN